MSLQRGVIHVLEINFKVYNLFPQNYAVVAIALDNDAYKISLVCVQNCLKISKKPAAQFNNTFSTSVDIKSWRHLICRVSLYLKLRMPDLTLTVRGSTLSH